MSTTAAANYTVKFENEIYHPNNTYVGSITSTEFTYNDSLGDSQSACKLDDKDSVLRVVKPIAGTITEIANNVGSVSYSSGKLEFSSFAPTAIVGSTIDITITPSSSDVRPVREQILLIQSENVTVTASTDQTEATGTVTSTATTSTSAGGSAGSGGY